MPVPNFILQTWCTYICTYTNLGFSSSDSPEDPRKSHWHPSKGEEDPGRRIKAVHLCNQRIHIHNHKKKKEMVIEEYLHTIGTIASYHSLLKSNAFRAESNVFSDWRLKAFCEPGHVSTILPTAKKRPALMTPELVILCPWFSLMLPNCNKLHTSTLVWCTLQTHCTPFVPLDPLG